MRAPGPGLIDRLAAEYVLGTLRGPARRRFERWLAAPARDATTRDAAQRAVRRWEDRLAPLEPRTRIEPSPRVWREVQRRTGTGRSGAAAWRPWALAASVLIVAFGAWFAFDARQATAQWQVAALLRPAAEAGTQWRVEYDPRTDALRVTAIAPPGLPTGTVHELWALGAGSAAPVSLGLLPQTGAQQRVLAPAQRAALLTATNLAVSREPAGGSPTGAPTGPVLLVAPRNVIATG